MASALNLKKASFASILIWWTATSFEPPTDGGVLGAKIPSASKSITPFGFVPFHSHCIVFLAFFSSLVISFILWPTPVHSGRPIDPVDSQVQVTARHVVVQLPLLGLYCTVHIAFPFSGFSVASLSLVLVLDNNVCSRPLCAFCCKWLGPVRDDEPVNRTFVYDLTV